jgi:hypothetical protein
MNEGPANARALELGREFDQSFSRLPPERTQGREALIGIGLGGNPYALRLSEISSLVQGKSLLSLRGQAAAFLGLAGQHGGLWPVWDLAALCGYAPAREPRWLALAQGPTLPWAAAFERFDGYFLAKAADFSALSAEGSLPFCSEACALGGLQRPLIRLSLALEAIQRTMPSPPKDLRRIDP